MTSRHLVFSYGTLKSGEPNFKVMNDPKTGSSTFVGSGETVKRFPLVVASEYAVPFLLLVEGKGENVQGEIYEVDDTKLASLDELECHPDFYHRKKTEIIMHEDHDGNRLAPPVIKECWVYFLPHYKPEMIDLPYLKSYTSISDDHPPYVERIRHTSRLFIGQTTLHIVDFLAQYWPSACYISTNSLFT